MMSGDAQQKMPMWLGLFWLGVIALFALSGLCTIFVAVVTVAQAWQEHNQESWPEVTARVENCRLHQSSTRKRDRYYIDCVLGYEIGLALNEVHVYSVRRVQWPSTGPQQEWLDAHPMGTPIAARYDPANHKKIVLMPPYMPGDGPHTPNNVKLLIVCAGSFLVLLVIVRMRWRTLRNENAVGPR